MNIVRRSVLMGGLVAASVAGAFGVSRLVGGGGKTAIAAESMAALLPALAGDLDAARVVGRALIEAGLVENDAAAIAERLAAALNLYRGTPAQRFAELQVREFASGTVVEVGGWIVARSFGDVAALSALTASG